MCLAEPEPGRELPASARGRAGGAGPLSRERDLKRTPTRSPMVGGPQRAPGSRSAKPGFCCPLAARRRHGRASGAGAGRGQSRAGGAGREGGDAWRGMPRTRGYFISSSKGVGRCWNPHGKFPLGEGPEGDSSAPGRWPQQPAPAAPSQVLPDRKLLLHLSGPPGQRCLPRAPHLARGVLATCSVARRASAAASAQ